MGELGTFVRGNGLQKSDFLPEGYPCIHYGQIYTFFGTKTETTKSFISHELASRLKKAPPQSLVMTTTSENVQDVAKSVAWLGAEDIAIGGHECAFIHEMNPLYLAYVVQTRAFQDQKDRFVKGTKVKDITTKDLAKILIPVPALEVQNRVAGEIESFDSLVNDISIGLPAELAARRKQYEYYRNKLLTFPEKVA